MRNNYRRDRSILMEIDKSTKRKFSSVEEVVGHLAEKLSNSLQEIIQENKKQRLDSKAGTTPVLVRDYNIQLGLHEFGIECNSVFKQGELSDPPPSDKKEIYGGCLYCEERGYNWVTKFSKERGTNVSDSETCKECDGQGRIKIVRKTNYEINYDSDSLYTDFYDNPKKRLVGFFCPRTVFVDSATSLVCYIKDICNALNIEYTYYGIKNGAYEMKVHPNKQISIEIDAFDKENAKEIEKIDFGSFSCKVTGWSCMRLRGISGHLTSKEFHGYRIKWRRQ